jgi:NAD(P)-dependent dehydrogenase (short-subunit alcohol dehydrogenase family)
MAMPTYTKTWHNDVYPDIDASTLSVHGKRTVITGAAGGIGAATVEAFAQAGAAEIFALGRTAKTLEATKAVVSNKYPNTKITPLVTDIANPDSVASAFSQIAHVGPIDILISNAAALYIGGVAAGNPVDWFQVYEVNIKGSLLVVQAALKNMATTDGVVINVSSCGGHVLSVPGFSAYASSKSAGIKMFEYLQQERPDLNIFNLVSSLLGGQHDHGSLRWLVASWDGIGDRLGCEGNG